LACGLGHLRRLTCGLGIHDSISHSIQTSVPSAEDITAQGSRIELSEEVPSDIDASLVVSSQFGQREDDRSKSCDFFSRSGSISMSVYTAEVLASQGSAISDRGVDVRLA